MDLPGLGAEAVPDQLEELKAQTQENRVLLPNGPHQDTEEEGLTQSAGNDATVPTQKTSGVHFQIKSIH